MKSFIPISYLLSLFTASSFLVYVMISVNFENSLEIQQTLEGEVYQRTKLPNGISSSKPESEILSVNRIPNCGGEVLIILLQWLTQKKFFKHHRFKSPINENFELRQGIHNLSMRGGRNSFDTTFFFEDFGGDNIFHISLLRDPLERIASMFYYDSVTPLPGMISSKEYFMKKMEFSSIESCIHNGGAQCHFDQPSSPVLPVSYFCGVEDYCRKHNSPAALKTAKENIVGHYMVVGVLEDLNVTLSVLEHQLPNFFEGSTELFTSMTKKRNWAPHMKLPPMEKWAEEFLRKHLKNEYELYDFVKRRLYQQAQAVVNIKHYNGQ